MRAEAVDTVLTASRAVLGVVAQSMGDALERVTLPQFRALTILTTTGPITARALADHLGVAPSTMSRSLDRLVAGGWVRREDNPHDRREHRIEATAAAVDLVSDVARERRRILESILDRVPDQDAAALETGFRLFIAAAGEPVSADLALLGRRSDAGTAAHAHRPPAEDERPIALTP